MTNKELADLIFPNIDKDINYYEEKYPERDLPDNAIVTRFAPSPTGFVHMGSLLTAFIEHFTAATTGGIFYLRIEDTDQKRSVENGIQGIINDLKNFDIKINEGVISETEQIGEYGPYIQTERKEIYQTYAKYLIEQGLAYPCFCTEEDLTTMRKKQEAKKSRLGYFGGWAKCRDLTNEERAEKIQAGIPYTIRLKSPGNFAKKVVLKDLVRGTIEFPENDLDVVLIKTDGIPIYHFAHAIDDHLMRTTHVLRAEEWVSSTPIHLQLFQILGFKTPKYGHLGLVMKIDETGARRKLSKRKDPEAAVSFYHEKGVPIEAVKLYLMTLANSNFEAWLETNYDKSIYDFKFDFKKISLSGSLFDTEKLFNISKNYISRLKADKLYEDLLEYTKEFDSEFYEILKEYKSYSTAILNIEREQKKPRKDFATYSDILPNIWYMYDEYFNKYELNYEFQNITDTKEIANILSEYLKVYDANDDKDMWFMRIKELCDKLGYASNMKEYKENPDKFKGNVADISTVLRVALTTKHQTPDLYEIMKLIGKEKMEVRYQKFCG